MSHLFTPKYIRMACAADEIQADPVLDVGEWWADEEETDDEYRGAWMKEYRSSDREDSWKWLPRLDRLFGMIPHLKIGQIIYDLQEGPGTDGWESYPEYTDQFGEWQDPQKAFDWCEFAIQVVMREVHGKRWNGIKWIKA